MMHKLFLTLLLIFLFSFNVFSYYKNTNSKELSIAQVMFLTSLKKADKGDIKTAIRLYIKAIEVDETIPAKNENGLLEKAVTFLKKELKRNPLDTESRYFLGRIFEIRGDFEKAAGEYKKLIKNFPKTQYAELSWRQVNRYLFMKTLQQ